MNEMGGEYSTYGGEVHTGVWWRNLRERDHLKDPGKDGIIILRLSFKWDGCHGLDCSCSE
jgi:hypothetical protein